jgi:uncharacterized membrane protein YfcA
MFSPFSPAGPAFAAFLFSYLLSLIVYLAHFTFSWIEIVRTIKGSLGGSMLGMLLVGLFADETTQAIVGGICLIATSGIMIMPEDEAE